MRVQRYICPVCDKNLKQKRAYFAHSHVQLLNHQANYTTYKFIRKQTKLHELMKLQTLKDRVEVCTEQLICLESLFPFISVPLSFYGHESREKKKNQEESHDENDSDDDAKHNDVWHKYGDPRCVSSIEKVG